MMAECAVHVWRNRSENITKLPKRRGVVHVFQTFTSGEALRLLKHGFNHAEEYFLAFVSPSGDSSCKAKPGTRASVLKKVISIIT